MYHLINNLLLYTTPNKNSILERLAEALSVKTDGQMGIEEKRRAINAIAKNILDLSTAYGFNRNLWQAYLTYHLVTCENSFSLTCEREMSILEC